MSGMGMGSGPFGELIAIDWLQIVAGMPIFLSMIVLIIAMMRRLSREIDDQAVGSVGYAMMIVSGFAAILYIAGFACIYTGLMWEGINPDRLPQNLLGSGGFFLIGLLVYSLPKVFNKLDAWSNDERSNTSPEQE